MIERLELGAGILTVLVLASGLRFERPNEKEAVVIVEYIRYEVPPAQHGPFVDAYRAAAKQLEASQHCLGYEVSEGVEEPDHFTVRPEWDSVEGHERGFRSSAQFGAFFAEVKPFFNQILEMKHYQILQRGEGTATP